MSDSLAIVMLGLVLNLGVSSAIGIGLIALWQFLKREMPRRRRKPKRKEGE